MIKLKVPKQKSEDGRSV